MDLTEIKERAPDHVELSTFAQSDSQGMLDDALQGSKPTGTAGFIPGPPWIINILLNELCERFSYYGLRAILPLYFVTLGWSENASISVFMFSSAGPTFVPYLVVLLLILIWENIIQLFDYRWFIVLGCCLLQCLLCFRRAPGA